MDAESSWTKENPQKEEFTKRVRVANLIFRNILDLTPTPQVYDAIVIVVFF